MSWEDEYTDLYLTGRDGIVQIPDLGLEVQLVWPDPTLLPWPWRQFYDLVAKHVGGEALWAVLSAYDVAVEDELTRIGVRDAPGT